AKVSNNGVDLRAVQNLSFKKRFSDFVKQRQIRFEKIFGLVITLLDDAANLTVDFYGGAFRVVRGLREIPPQKYFLFLLAKGHRSEFFAHAPLADHPVREFSGFFDVVPSAGC